MKSKEFKAQLFDLLAQNVDGMTAAEKMTLAENLILEYQIKHDQERDTPNRGKPWSNEELRVILQSAPTKENCLRYAKLFGRSTGSLELIYRWASTADSDIPEKYEDDRFIQQVKRIAKEVGWRAS